MHLDILNKNMYVHPIILNKDNSPLTFFNNSYYVLMKTIYYGQKVNLNNIIPFTKIKTDLNNNNWANLWSLKNDYLEYQMSMLGRKHPLLRDSFSYFLGLGETAIALANMVDGKSSYNVYAHKRICKNDTTFDLYNPLNIKVDLKVRDAAEYFKQSFFSGNDINIELTNYLNSEVLTTYEYIMFFSRMLYPTYYFDIYEEIITGREDEKNIMKIINKVNDYEIILKSLYKHFKTFLNIFTIEWLE